MCVSGSPFPNSFSHLLGAPSQTQNSIKVVSTVLTFNTQVSSKPLCSVQILAEDSIQADVYQAAVQPVVEDVLNGYNGTIMAYGQTGAGKTYTLSSIQPEAIGMIPRAASEVFAHIAADALNEYTVFMSYIQIYMEMIQVHCKAATVHQMFQSQSGNSLSVGHYDCCGMASPILAMPTDSCKLCTQTACCSMPMHVPRCNPAVSTCMRGRVALRVSCMHNITHTFVRLHHIVSHHIASHHITSHHITSHHITSPHITSHHITSHHISMCMHPITTSNCTLHQMHELFIMPGHDCCMGQKLKP